MVPTLSLAVVVFVLLAARHDTIQRCSDDHACAVDRFAGLHAAEPGHVLGAVFAYDRRAFDTRRLQGHPWILAALSTFPLAGVRLVRGNVREHGLVARTEELGHSARLFGCDYAGHAILEGVRWRDLHGLVPAADDPYDPSPQPGRPCCSQRDQRGLGQVAEVEKCGPPFLFFSVLC